MTTIKPARTFGLVAGLGVGAGIFYYQALVEQHLALGMSPQLLMVHADVRRVCAPELAALTPLPLISLLDVIVAEVERRRPHRVVLFGAEVTMEPGSSAACPTWT